MLYAFPRSGSKLLYDDGSTQEVLEVLPWQKFVGGARRSFERASLCVRHPDDSIAKIRAGKPGDWNPYLTLLPLF